MDDSATIDSTLFKEIGNTLQEVGQEALNGTVASVKNSLARRVVQSQEGQQQIAMSIIPYLVLAIIAVLILRRFVH